MCAAIASSMCTKPTVVFGYSPLAPDKNALLERKLTRKVGGKQLAND